MPRDPFLALADRFAGHYGTLRGAVRAQLVARQLSSHIAAPPAEVADVGGGAGEQAIRLARMGYRVCLLDPSETMLTQARDALRAQPIRRG